jgi:hypothetical protein
VTQLKTVVLPAPFGPMSAVMSPRPTEKLKALTATRPPNRMVRFSTASSVLFTQFINRAPL